MRRDVSSRTKATYFVIAFHNSSERRKRRTSSSPTLVPSMTYASIPSMRAARNSVALPFHDSSMPERRHESASMATGATGSPSSPSSVKSDASEVQPRRRAAVITPPLRVAPLRIGYDARRDENPLGLSEALPGRSDLRPLHGPPAVLPQPAGRHHAGTSGEGYDFLRRRLRH